MESGSMPVDPAAVLEHFGEAPAEMQGIAISGVDERTLRDEWVSCISQEPNTFDRPGSGYMVHPMRVLPMQMYDGSIPPMTIVREQSFNFGWPDYPFV